MPKAIVLCLVLAGWVPALAAEDVASLAQRAADLEASGRWLAAMDVYAELMRIEPGTPAWERHWRRATRQHQISTRWSNSVARQRAEQLPLDRALEHFAEVLGLIERQYVDAVPPGRLFQLGLERMDLAFHNAVFQEAVFSAGSRPSTVSVRGRWGGEPVADLAAARNRLKNLAVSLQQETGARPAVIVQEFTYAICEALDEYSGYLTPERLALELALLNEQLGGVCIDLQRVNGRLLIGYVEPGSMAARVGLRINDEVVAIDGTLASSLSIEEAGLRLLGTPGSRIVLQVQSATDNAPRQAVLTREILRVSSVTEAQIVDGEAGVGYVHVAIIQKGTPDELFAAIDRLADRGMQVLILDLRGNPGGSFEAAIRIASRFIRNGVLVQVRGRGFSNRQPQAASPVHEAIPLVLLVDGDTASSSEVIAAAIRDYRRGLIVGERTKGKGSLQQLFPLHVLPAGLRLTTARIYTPQDRPLEGTGVEPDILVERPVDMDGVPHSLRHLMERQERQFEAALQAARRLVGKP